uniref:Cyclin-T1-like n=1 Tax=Gouania willdenowi TaxID=441366 RepID=A0A8C5GEH5_GOUWI
MACNNKWYYTRQQIDDNPSRRAGLDPDKELSYRQQAANLLQDMGQRLNVSQLTINTAIVYMHRFYMVQSFTRFHRNVISPAALFLAAKVEEQPRKLEHVIKVAHACLNPQEPSPDTRSDAYLQEAQDLVILESIILQTLAFEITIDHPHTHVVKCTQLVRASKDLAQTSYFMATNSLHLTTFCLQYSPPVVACVCIHLACKWSNWEIPVSTDEKHWWEYVDPTVTLELLDGMLTQSVMTLSPHSSLSLYYAFISVNVWSSFTITDKCDFVFFFFFF